MAVTLTASADFGQTGQYVARLTGRDSKFTFVREFIGSKGGKRGDFSSAMIDDPGVYEVRDSTRKGKVDKYYLIGIRPDNGELRKLLSDKEDAMVVCKALDAGRKFENIVRFQPNAEDPAKTVYELLASDPVPSTAAGISAVTAVEILRVAVTDAIAKLERGELAGDVLRVALEATKTIA